MKKKLNKSIAVLLCIIMTLASCSLAASALSNVFTAPDGWFQVSNTEKTIAPGIVENEVIVNKASGQNQVMGYAVAVDMSAGSKTKILAGYNNYDGSTWAMQTVRDQANKAEKARNLNIVAAFNADIFNMSTGEPTGTLVMNGINYKSGLGRPYFAILKDGSAVIGGSLTQAILDNTVEAVSGFYTLVENGNRTYYGNLNDSTLAPRTTVGIRADKTVVIYVADGRNYPISCGLNNYDLASMMIGLGCVDVLNLDGGGSTTYAAQYEGCDTLEVANNPSDGVERKVSSCLFVASTALPSGEFDHASLEPNNLVYTPNSTVQFSATGVDSAGGKASLPDGGTFVLAADSTGYGVITADGKFTSNGTCGAVNVNYVKGSTVYGTTGIVVAQPDEVYFSDEQVSLGFSYESNLGLNVKYKGRDVIYKDGDFIWSTEHDPVKLGDKFEYNNQSVIYNADDSTLHYFETRSQPIYKTDGYGNIVYDGNGSPVVKEYVTVMDIKAALTQAEQDDFYATILGSFKGNMFTSSSGNSINGVIHVKYAKNEAVKASVKAIIGRLPTVVQDFEANNIEFGRVAFAANGGVLQWESDNSETANMLTGHYLNGSAGSSSRGGNESAEIVSVDSGEPVRFGNQSLKLNYDFTKINGIEGACVGFTEKGTTIEGSPTGIGMWVYVPEGTPNFWLRIRLLDGQDNILTLNYTSQTIGINWNGWKYVECDLTGKQGPFKLLAGETIRLMHTYSAYGGMGDWLAGTVTTSDPTKEPGAVKLERSTCKGSVYIDNLQFVYGANVDDIDNPVVDTITANGTEITDGCILDTNTVDFESYFHDVQNKYTSGIDYDVVRLYVDGVNRTYDSSYVLTQGDERLDLYGLQLADGDHTVMVLLRDKFGNETTDTRNFTIKTQSGSDLTSVYTDYTDSPYLGQEFELDLTSNNIQLIKNVDTTLKVGADFKDYTADFNDAFTGTATFNSKTNEITVKAERNALVSSQDYIARLKFKIPTTLALGSKFTYSISAGKFEQVDAAAETIANSFALSTQRIDIIAPLSVTTDPMVVGMGGYVYVTDKDGNPAGGINVYKADGSLLATTSKSGSFYTDAFTGSVADFAIYAKNGKDISYIYSSQSVESAGKVDGTPTQIMVNASSDSVNEKNITWLSNPKASGRDPVVQYAEKSEYSANGEASFITAEGVSEIRQLLGSGNITENYAVRLNTVEVSGLKAATTYVYRVGDGTNFSDTSEFSTTYAGVDTKFFIIGDTQAEDTTNIANIIKSLETSGDKYSFGVQTGDFVEKPTLYSNWNAILNVFGQKYLTTVDMIHVIGNHEQFGDDFDNLFASALFNTEAKTHYSVEYGNVYVAVLNYTIDRSQFESEMEWLIEDSANSDCQWKIVVSHQPAYGTNAASTDTGDFHALLPEACEKADIDFVFSGHDHAFARTRPLTGGEIDEENGVVYYVCGSTGEKSYTATNNPAYHFDVVDQEYNAIYLTVDATDAYFRVIAHESNGAAIDTYTMLSDEACKTQGHVFKYSEGYLTCTKCGHAELVGTYTGFAKDKATGRNMYFLGGNAKIGWFTYLNDCYYFDENGLAVTGKQTIDGIGFKFDNEGKQIGGTFVTDENGITRCYRGGTYIIGWQEIGDYMYYFSSKGNMASGKATVIVRTGQKLECEFSADGKLLKGAFYETTDGTKYYWGGDLASGWTVIDGEKYYFDPMTNIMATDTVEIDGKYYAFDTKGIYVHDEAHEWEIAVDVGSSNCKVSTFRVYRCSVCEKEKIVVLDATDHVDENGDGLCDVCGNIVSINENTPKAVFTKIIDAIRNFIQKIIDFLKFGK